MTGAITNIDLSCYNNEVIELNQPPYQPGYYYVLNNNAFGPYEDFSSAEESLLEFLVKKEMECVYF
jgi:hypothetical protein